MQRLRLLAAPHVAPCAWRHPLAMVSAVAHFFRNLDQIAVGIAQIDRQQLAFRAGAHNWAFQHWPRIGLDPRNDLVQRLRRDEAKIEAAGRRRTGFRLKLFAAYVQVDLLPAEAEGLALYRRRAAGKDFQAHAEQPRIKIDARLFVIRGQHKVVETFEHIRSVVAGGFAKLVK